MVLLAIILGCVLGIVIGIFAPVISFAYSSYLAIAILAALDSVFGGLVAIIKKNFNITTFISGFFGNAILAIALTILGEKLGLDIKIAAIIVFVGRMFNNLGIIRRYYADKFVEFTESKTKSKKPAKKTEK